MTYDMHACRRKKAWWIIHYLSSHSGYPFGRQLRLHSSRGHLLAHVSFRGHHP